MDWEFKEVEEQKWRGAVCEDFRKIWDRLDIDRSAILISLICSLAALVVAVLK